MSAKTSIVSTGLSYQPRHRGAPHDIVTEALPRTYGLVTVPVHAGVMGSRSHRPQRALVTTSTMFSARLDVSGERPTIRLRGAFVDAAVERFLAVVEEARATSGDLAVDVTGLSDVDRRATAALSQVAVSFIADRRRFVLVGPRALVQLLAGAAVQPTDGSTGGVSP